MNYAAMRYLTEGGCPVEGAAWQVVAVIAWHADKTTGDSYISRRNLAMQARLSTSTVHEILAGLLGRGVLEIVIAGAGRRATTYRVITPDVRCGSPTTEPQAVVDNPVDNVVVARSDSRSGSVEPVVVARSGESPYRNEGKIEGKIFEGQTATASTAPTDPTADAVGRRSVSGNGVPPDEAAQLATFKADLTAKVTAEREAERRRLEDLLGPAATELVIAPTRPAIIPPASLSEPPSGLAPDPADVPDPAPADIASPPRSPASASATENALPRPVVQADTARELDPAQQSRRRRHDKLARKGCRGREPPTRCIRSVNPRPTLHGPLHLVGPPHRPDHHHQEQHPPIAPRRTTAAAPSKKGSSMSVYRQGDVLVISTESIPAEAKPVPRAADGAVVLALGEATGHRHVLLERHVTLHALSDREVDDRFLQIVGAEARLVHEEHATITLPPGNYVVRRQREYTSADMAPSTVAD